jgi:hypothetical protein
VADSKNTAATKELRAYFSRDVRTRAQNRILAECVVERLTTMAKKILRLADLEKGAVIAMLAAEHCAVHGNCLAETATNETSKQA